MSDEVRRRAEAGDAEAEFEMFQLESRDDLQAPMAFHWLARSARQGYGPAVSNLGICYLNGRFGLPRDPGRALECFAVGAQKGSALAFWGVGVLHREGLGLERDASKARELFLVAASGGLPYAQRDLATLLYEGQGGPPDVAQALVWMERAAAAEEPEAGYRLAEWLVAGAGGRARIGEGMERMAQLACAGHPAAQAQLGGLYAAGEGVEPDLLRALFWLLSAVEQDNPYGMLRLGVLLAESNPAQAIRWLEEAARHGLKDGHALEEELRDQLLLSGRPWDFDAYLTETVRELVGDPSVPSFEVGLALLTARAERNDAAALMHLSMLHYYGLGVPVAVGRALELLTRAADLGDPGAQAQLEGFRHVGYPVRP